MPRINDRPQQDRDAHLPIERIGGRYVTQYNPEIALQIVEKVAAGETINKICEKGSGFPHPTTFRRWVVNNAQLARALDAAMKLSAKSLEEEALDIAREIKRAPGDGTKVQAFRALLDQLRWSAERRDPATYGTRAPVSVRVPIHIHTTLDMGKVERGAVDGQDIYTVVATKKQSVGEAIEAAGPGDDAKPLVETTPKWSRK